MKSLVLILAVLLIAGCSADTKMKSFDEIDYLLTSEWLYAQKISNIKDSGEVITRPPGVDQLVLSLSILQAGGKGLKSHCVYYHIPYKKNPGIIKIDELKNADVCPDTPSADSLVIIKNVTDLKILFKNFKLQLAFVEGSIKRLIDVPLMNVESGLVHQKYSPVQEKRLYDGMQLLRLNEDSFDYASNRYLGKVADRFSRATAIRCHQVSKDCEDIGENRCNDCRYGWFEVVDYQCPQGGSKFCGQNHCGEKNEPACPRGDKVESDEGPGICQSDLEPVLNADKILVCQ